MPLTASLVKMSSRRVIISTTKAPAAVGAYSQAVLLDKTLYCSGQVGLDPKTGKLVQGGASEEAKRALTNLGEVLKAAGSDYGKVVKTTVLLADIQDFKAVNEVYKGFFKDSLPARAAYQAANLPLGAKVEVEAVAVVGEVVDEPMSKL